MDSDVQKLVVDDRRHMVSALEPVTSLILDTQFQSLHVLVGFMLEELQTFESNACGAFILIIRLSASSSASCRSTRRCRIMDIEARTTNPVYQFEDSLPLRTLTSKWNQP